MRLVAAFLVLTPALAHADGVAFDFGVVHSRVAVTDETALDATGIRFAIAISPPRSRHVRFGAEAEEGWLRGTTSLPAGAVARTTTPPGNESPLGGNTLALRLFVNGHTDVGPVRLGGALAGGMRDTWVSSDSGTDVAGRKYEPLLEVRTRIDFRLTPGVLVGASVSTDLIERRDVSVAIVLGIDLTSRSGR